MAASSYKEFAEKLNISEQDVADFKNAFTAYDQNDSGTISTDEFTDLLKTLDQEQESIDLFKKFDIDGKPGLSFEEFVTMASINFTPSEFRVIRELKYLYKDGDGFISKQELKGLFTKYVPPGKLQAVFNEYDTDGDGQITVKEFLKTYVAKMKDKKIAEKLGLSEQDVADFKNAFTAYDQDDSGTMSTDEFKDLLKTLDQEEVCIEGFKKADIDGKPGLNFEEFVGLASKFFTPSEFRVVRELKNIDKDGDGFISKQELKGLFTKYVPPGKLQAVFNEYDADGDGQITVKEFLKTYVAKMKDKKIAEKLGLSEQDVADFKNAFTAYDQDDSGTMSTDEFKDLLKTLDQEEVCIECFKKADIDGKPGLNFEEFVGLASKFFTPSEFRVVRELKNIDKDGDGFISKTELKGLFTAYVPPPKLRAVFDEYDKDGDDKITIKEFLQTYKSKGLAGDK